MSLMDWKAKEWESREGRPQRVKKRAGPVTRLVILSSAFLVLVAGVSVAVLLPDGYHSVLAPAYLHVIGFTGKPGGGFVVDHRMTFRVLAVVTAAIISGALVVLEHQRSVTSTR